MNKQSKREKAIAIGGIVRRQAAEGEPQRVLANIEVALPDLGLTVTSDGDGRYLVYQVPDGDHRVILTGPDGERSERSITVPSPSYNLEL